MKIILGAGLTRYSGWFPTDVETVNVAKEKDFKKYFGEKKMDKVLLEHVVEHLPTDVMIKM